MFAAWSPCEQKGLHAQQPGPLCQGPQGQRQPVCSLGRNLEPGRDEEKSGSQEEKQKKNQTLKHILNLTPTPASVRSEPTTTPVYSQQSRIPEQPQHPRRIRNSRKRFRGESRSRKSSSSSEIQSRACTEWVPPRSQQNQSIEPYQASKQESTI